MIENTLTVESCFYKDVEHAYTPNIDMSSIHVVRNEIERNMLSLLHNTKVMYNTLLHYLRTKKTAKHAFHNKNLIHEHDRVCATKIVSSLIQAQEYDVLSVYISSELQPKYYIILEAFKMYKATYATNKYEYSAVSLQRFEQIKNKYKAEVVDAMCASCYPLVVKFANNIKSNKLSKHDRIAYGNVGLMEAVHRFDFTAGVKFSTYAMWWIRESIYKGIYTQTFAVKLKSTMYEDYLLLMSGSKDKKDSVSDETRLYLQHAMHPKQYQHESGGYTDFDMPDDMRASAEHIYASAHWLAKGEDIIKDILTEEEYFVLTRHFGIFGCSSQSITSLCHETGRSHYILTNIKETCLRKLRNNGVSTLLAEFIHA